LLAVHPVTAAAATTVVATTKPKPENKLRDKVAALVANAQSSAETRIKDIDRQRQEDMQIISNRFNKQKELFDIQPAVTSAPAPTRPPAPDPPRAPAPALSKVVRPMPPPHGQRRRQGRGAGQGHAGGVAGQAAAALHGGQQGEPGHGHRDKHNH